MPFSTASCCGTGSLGGHEWASTLVIASIVATAIRVADQWNKAIVLRLGKFHALRGPGLFFVVPVIDTIPYWILAIRLPQALALLVVPVIDTIPYWIDTRVITGSFKAEKTLIKDAVPVDVDAALFWRVLDPKKATRPELRGS